MVILTNIVSSALFALELNVPTSSADTFKEQQIGSYHHADPIQLEDSEEKIQESTDEQNEEDPSGEKSVIAGYLLSGAVVHYALSYLERPASTVSIPGYPPYFILFENFRL